MQEQSPSDWRSLHPAAVFVWVLDNLRLGLFPLLALAFSGGWIVLPLAGLGLLASALYSFLRWKTFGFKIEGESLVIRDGVLSIKQTVIPLARIQSVDSVQKLRHSMFGVVEIRAETVGSESTEGRLAALLPADAEALRGDLLRASETAQPEAYSPTLARLKTKDLLIAGATGGRVAIFAVILGYLQDLIPGDPFETFIESKVDEVGREGLGALSGAVMVVGILLIVSILISLIATVFVYWEFTVTQQGNRLVVSRGLLEKRVSSIPLRRVQAGRINENFVRRMLGLASATLVVAGYAGQKEEVQETSMILPIGRKKAAAELIHKIVGGTELSLEAAPAAALARRLLFALTPGFLVLGSSSMWRPAVFVGTGLVILGAIVAYALWRSLGSALGESHVAVRSGFLIRTTTVTPIANVQNLGLYRTPLQRALDLATVELGIPKAKPRAADLTSSDAERMFALVEAKL